MARGVLGARGCLIEGCSGRSALHDKGVLLVLLRTIDVGTLSLRNVINVGLATVTTLLPTITLEHKSKNNRRSSNNEQ